MFRRIVSILTSVKFYTALFVVAAMSLLPALLMQKKQFASGSSSRYVRSFYYWKNTNYDLDSAERATLINLQVRKLYVKFFEVEKSELYGSVPAAKMELHIFPSSYTYDSIWKECQQKLEVIPVVFVRNEVLRGASKESLDTLANNISFLTDKYYNEKINARDLKYTELQIDCDWTINTKDNYFYLLRALRRETGRKLSCTLRLYPYKYPQTMGVPPVDRATLMCYNLLKPLENPGKNSIVDPAELTSYLEDAKPYPLPLDVALPIYSWMLLYHNGAFAGSVPEGEVDPALLTTTDSLWYDVRSDMDLGRVYLRKGDRIKWERVSPELLEQVIGIVRENVPLQDSAAITFFHFDSKLFHRYTNETLDRLYSRFDQ